jgi:hypothetical protein
VGWAQIPDLGWGRKPKLHGMQGVKARIGLAVPGRPIGPWSRRTGAPEASATGRDRNPRCSPTYLLQQRMTPMFLRQRRAMAPTVHPSSGES